MYKIFSRIPVCARRYAASLEYNQYKIAVSPTLALRSNDDLCPLGACLKSLGATKSCYTDPGPDEVSGFLLNLDSDSMIYPYVLEILEDESRRFIHDWDNGLVRNLYIAMGVKQAKQ